MRIGVCCPFDQAPSILEAGFDYVELPAHWLLTADLSALRGVPVEATNLFFPSGVTLYGTDAFDWRSYASQLLPVAASVGVQVMVMGSGTQRRSLPGMPVGEAEHAFFDIVGEVQELASAFGIQIAPESLSRDETDVGNDPAVLASELAERGVAYTLDTYHFFNEWAAQGEPVPLAGLTVDQRLTLRPLHVHLANRPRFVPSEDDSEVRLLIQKLKEMKFAGRVSLECKEMPVGEGLEEACKMVRGLWA